MKKPVITKLLTAASSIATSVMIKTPTTTIAVTLTLLALSGCAQQETPNTVKDKTSSMEAEMVKGNQLSDFYVLKSESIKQIEPNKSVQLTFSVKEKQSEIPVRSFERVHEKLAHLIVVSKDLTEFQHLHPDIVGAGKLSVKTTFPKDGQYLCFLQFSTPEHEEQTVKETLQVGSGSGGAEHRLVPDADKPKIIDGYKFSISSLPTATNVATMPMVAIEKDGRPVANIQPYLGAGGHGVIVSEDAQYFLHVHPMSEATDGKYASPVMFHTVIPKPGLYKMWAQFQIDGKLKVADFTFRVK